jgi:hypothetical protein
MKLRIFTPAIVIAIIERALPSIKKPETKAIIAIMSTLAPHAFS